MPEKINLPDMGEGVESATVATILVKVGDEIAVDQGIVELETDKAVAEVPSPRAGKVSEILVEPGQELTPGAPLITLEGSGDESESKSEKQEEKQEKEKPADAKTGKTEKKKPGKTEEKPKPEEKEAEEEPEEKRGDTEPPSEEKPSPPAPRSEDAADIPAAPSVRRLARELGVDLRAVQGSGNGGWIDEADVKAAAKKTIGTAAPSGDTDGWGPIRREKMKQIRRTIAKKMKESHAQAIHVTHFADADVTELEAFRRKHRDDFGPDGVPLTLLAFVVRAAVDALKEHPIVNASLEVEDWQIVYKEYYSIGIAVDTERGLVVPVLRNADRLSIEDTAKAIRDIAAKMRSDDFDVEDLRGGTFSISNLGSIGGKYATPIINYPQSAVLLTGTAEKRPVVVDGDIKIRTILPLSLTYDHRLIDGAEAQRFLNEVIGYLEDHGRLLVR